MGTAGEAEGSVESVDEREPVDEREGLGDGELGGEEEGETLPLFVPFTPPLRVDRREIDCSPDKEAAGERVMEVFGLLEAVVLMEGLLDALGETLEELEALLKVVTELRPLPVGTSTEGEVEEVEDMEGEWVGKGDRLLLLVWLGEGLMEGVPLGDPEAELPMDDETEPV